MKNFKKRDVIVFTVLLVLAAVMIFTLKTAKDPLADFHVSDLADLHSNKAVTDDYRDYIQKLSAEEKDHLGPILYYENSSGQHAVRIETNQKNECWYNVLIYDNRNKRVRTIKSYNGRYQC